MIFIVSELMLATLIFTGCQLSHFMIILITTYQFIKPFLDNKMSIFEEYGAFKIIEQSRNLGIFN